MGEINEERGRHFYKREILRSQRETSCVEEVYEVVKKGGYMKDWEIENMAKTFKNLDNVIYKTAARGYPLPPKLVASFVKGLRREVYEALHKDLNNNTPHGGY